ncbi:MAG: hypothetical protein CBD38_03195 [bacterium TMED178]|nr:MAG: hypothetical protein CBD38_03195 [bacterium TMED178]
MNLVEKKDVRKFNKKIKVIESLIQKLKNEKLFLKTGSFQKDIDDRIKRLKMEIKIAEEELDMTNENLNIEKKEFESLKTKLSYLNNKNTEQYSKDSYKKHLENIFKKDTNLKKTKTIVNLSDMSVEEIEENFILKPISEGVKLHNSVFSKYGTHNVKKTSYDYNTNVYKRYNLLENLNILKTSSKERFFAIMGKFKLTVHMDKLIKVDKKYRRIIYEHAISLISSFVPNNLIDDLLEDTKYEAEIKEKNSKTYAPTIGWIYKNEVLETVKGNAYDNILEGKQKFIRGKLNEFIKNVNIHFVERVPKEFKNTNVKIQIINDYIEPWRKRYLKHKILLNQVNEKKLYLLTTSRKIIKENPWLTGTRDGNIYEVKKEFKPEKFINENILEKMAENDIKQIYEEMDNKEKIKKFLKDELTLNNKKDIENKIKDCAYKHLSGKAYGYIKLEQLIQSKISHKNNLQTTRGFYDNNKAKINRKKINETHKEIIELKKRQQDIAIPNRLAYITQISSIVDKRKEGKMKEGGYYTLAELDKDINEIVYNKKIYEKNTGLFYDTRLPNRGILNFKIPEQTKESMNLSPREVKLVERKLLLDEMMIKKISNTIDYNKFDIDEFTNDSKSHTNAVVGKNVEDIIKSFQKELPTGFYTEDKENIKKQLKKVLDNGKCSQDVKDFLMEKVVPIKGSRYNFSTILEQNKNRRSRNYYNKYLKDKYNTYEEYENYYIRQQKALFDKVKNKPRRGASFLRLKRKDKDGNDIDTSEIYNEVRENREIKISFNIPTIILQIRDEKKRKDEIDGWFEKYFDIFPANKETAGLVQDGDYFMRDSLYVDDLRKEKIKALPARNINPGYMKRTGYIVNWITKTQTFQFNFERHELISFLFCRVQFMMNNPNINNVTKQKRLLIVLKILYYLQENINSNTLPLFIEYEEEVNMNLCTGEEFNKDTMSKIKRLIDYCKEQIEEFYLNLKILTEELPNVTPFLTDDIKNNEDIGIPSWLYETTSSQKESIPDVSIRRGGPTSFDLSQIIKNPPLGIMNTTSYDSKMVKYSYKQNIKKLVNLYKPKLLGYEKEYIRLWNLSGNSRKSIITDVEREVLDNLDFRMYICDKKYQIEIFRELCNRIIIPIIKDSEITNKDKYNSILKIFEKLFNNDSGIDKGIRYDNNKILNKNFQIVEEMKKKRLSDYSNIPFIVLREYNKFDINNLKLLLEGKFRQYEKSLKEQNEDIKKMEKLVEDLINYVFKNTESIVRNLIQVIKDYQNLNSITNITSKDIMINVIKKSLAKMFLEDNKREYFEIAQDLNENGLKNFKIVKNKVDNNTLKRDLEDYKKNNKNITNKDIALCILKQVELVHSVVDDSESDTDDDLWEPESENLETKIDISKGVEFYLDEVKGELFKTTIRPDKDLKKTSIRKDNKVALRMSVKGNIENKEAYLISGSIDTKEMRAEILYLINRAIKFQKEKGTISLYLNKFRHTFNDINQFKDFLMSHLKYPEGKKELKDMYDIEKGYEIDETIASKRSRLFGKKRKRKKVKKKRRKKVKKRRKIKKKKKSKK